MNKTGFKCLNQIGINYLVGVSFPFCVLLVFALGVRVAVPVPAAAAAAAALLRDVIGDITADLPVVLMVLLR